MKYCLIFIILLQLNYASAATIENIVNDNPSTSIAILVKDLKTDKEIYSYNPDKLMIPASVTKSFTTYAALEFLKPNFIYETNLYIDQDDNLYIKFSGDPSFTMDNLLQLLNNLPKKHYNNIYIDDTIFDQTYYGNGWSIEDSKFCFAAPSSSIVINKNCFKATLKPAKNSGNLAIFNTSEKIFARINNKIITKDDPTCSPHLVAHHDNSYDLTGCINIFSKEISLNIAYQDPRLMIKDIIADNLEGNISFKSIENSFSMINQHKSAPLTKIAMDMHKDSENISANNITKTIGANYYKAQGNFNNGNKAIAEILAKTTNIDPTKMRLADGSGISRYNLVSARQLVSLYSAAYNNASIGPEFYASLPVSAIDGSLSNRFPENPEFHSRIYAKTGSMSGVTALVGFIDKDFVFAIMLNGYLGSKSELAKLEEKILTTALKN